MNAGAGDDTINAGAGDDIRRDARPRLARCELDDGWGDADAVSVVELVVRCALHVRRVRIVVVCGRFRLSLSPLPTHKDKFE